MEDDDQDEYDEYGVKIKKELKLGEADPDFQPDDEFEDVADEDDLGIASIEDFVPARGRGGQRGRGGGMVGLHGSRTEGGAGSYSNGKVSLSMIIRENRVWGWWLTGDVTGPLQEEDPQGLIPLHHNHRHDRRRRRVSPKGRRLHRP